MVTPDGGFPGDDLLVGAAALGFGLVAADAIGRSLRRDPYSEELYEEKKKNERLKDEIDRYKRNRSDSRKKTKSKTESKTRSMSKNPKYQQRRGRGKTSARRR